ncbi:MAG: peptidoglycan-binding protein [Clostridia bacterium]|nr:peptidoglycan-binding protein [Clostridia bacterium]
MKKRLLALLLALFMGVSLAARAENAVLANAALVVDGKTGEILYQQNAFEALPPASTAKIMTGLLVCEAVARGDLKWDQVIPASEKALANIAWDASRLDVPIQVGEELSVAAYFYGAMLCSDTYSCRVLAHAVGGSVSGFVAMMNERAEQLGCASSNFTNATGYPEGNMTSSCWDLYLIARQAMTHPAFAQVVSTPAISIPATNMSEERILYNSNWLLGMPPKAASVAYSMDYSYPYCMGIKTGYTAQAGNCLVAYGQRGDRSVYTVILGAQAYSLADGTVDRAVFSETIRLMDWVLEADAVTALAVRTPPAIQELAYQVVQRGSTGERVRQIQTALKERGFYTGAIDGNFGQQTFNAVVAFQVAQGLTADGIAGRQTQNALLGTSY